MMMDVFFGMLTLHNNDVNIILETKLTYNAHLLHSHRFFVVIYTHIGYSGKPSQMPKMWKYPYHLLLSNNLSRTNTISM